MSLIINQHGGKLTDKRAAEELSRELDRVGQDTDNLKENLNGASVVEVLDKFVAVREYEEFGVNIWIEGESDVCIHFYPADHSLQFEFSGLRPGRESVEAFARMSDRVGGNLIRNAVGKLPADAGYYLCESGNQRTPQFDRSRKGVDLFEVRLFGLFKKIRWSSIAAEFIKAHREYSKQLQPYSQAS